MSRPWKVNPDIWFGTKELFDKWLRERNGIVVYENHMMDSSRLASATLVAKRRK